MEMKWEAIISIGYGGYLFLFSVTDELIVFAHCSFSIQAKCYYFSYWNMALFHLTGETECAVENDDGTGSMCASHNRFILFFSSVLFDPLCYILRSTERERERELFKILVSHITVQNCFYFSIRPLFLLASRNGHQHDGDGYVYTFPMLHSTPTYTHEQTNVPTHTHMLIPTHIYIDHPHMVLLPIAFKLDLIECLHMFSRFI